MTPSSRGCGHVTVDVVCGATPTNQYLMGARCSSHTPAACAGRRESVPDPRRTLVGLRTAAGIAADLIAPMAAGSLLDDRAVASGRRRSNQETYLSARTAEQARKDREKATRRGGQS